MSINIVDCTLRDGGYYNKWDFDFELVNKYLEVMAKTNIDVVELGYRFSPKDSYYGPYAYTTEELIGLLNIPDGGPKLAVMVDESELTQFEGGSKLFVEKYFCEEQKSKISYVRVAVHQERLLYAKDICINLKKLGYTLCLNIMQINRCDERRIIEISSEVHTWGLIDTLYFADSMGSLTVKQVETIVLAIKKGWRGEIGFHAHNNCFNALDNSLKAIEVGCTWIDATVNGMGRGAGNTPIEMLLISLQESEALSEDLSGLFELVLNEFSVLKIKYGWGGSLLYQLAAMKCIHPLYVQKMLVDNNYGTNSLLETINYLSENDGHVFSEKKLHEMTINGDIKQGANNLKGLFKNKDILIIGPGNSTTRNKKMLELFIEGGKFIVLSATLSPVVEINKIDYFVSSNFIKNYSSFNQISSSSSKFILPKSTLPQRSNGANVLDYEANINEGVFIVGDNQCQIPTDKSLLYALAIGVSSEANNVFLAGFDGYDENDTRQREMTHSLALFESSYGYGNIYSLTPTKYNIPVRSLYEPIL